jgi:hypothetical protein
MQDRWEYFLKNWGKINKKMKDIGFLEFGMLNDFVNLNDVVKQCMESDEKFEVNISEVKRMEGGLFKRLTDRIIGATWVLQYLNPKIDRFKYRVMEMKDKLNAPMDQHHFLHLHNCEDLFS